MLKILVPKFELFPDEIETLFILRLNWARREELVVRLYWLKFNLIFVLLSFCFQILHRCYRHHSHLSSDRPEHHQTQQHLLGVRSIQFILQAWLCLVLNSLGSSSSLKSPLVLLRHLNRRSCWVIPFFKLFFIINFDNYKYNWAYNYYKRRF